MPPSAKRQPGDPSEGTVRIDRWLFAARIFKSRGDARDACVGGHVRLNGRPVKPGHGLREGYEISGSAPRGKIVLIVRELTERRVSAPLARELYEDRSPPPPPRDSGLPQRDRGSGRPTRAERRALERLQGSDEER